MLSPIWSPCLGSNSAANTSNTPLFYRHHGPFSSSMIKQQEQQQPRANFINDEQKAVQALLELSGRAKQPLQLGETRAQGKQPQDVHAGISMGLPIQRPKRPAIIFVYHVILQRPSLTYLRGLHLTRHLEDTHFEGLLSTLRVPDDVFELVFSVEGPGFKGREKISLRTDKNYQERRWRSAISYLGQMPEKISRQDWQGSNDTLVYEVNFELIGCQDEQGQMYREEFDFTI
ncbi:hypothetical protein JX265_014023 [Neoarthrinium moseri]|uniref:Uncharacterized protein n=1 Tax=Neoarthrinium moseri TaxID=1658444 RepID=A0A9P9W7J9_9PEZI|nr:hypothetical protein JX265_014023 [Neoarthrinium moseri]